MRRLYKIKRLGGDSPKNYPPTRAG